MPKNGPEKKNALTDDMYNRLADEMIEADQSADVRAILFLGAGGDFTTGNDIGDFMRISQTGRGAGNMGVAQFLRQQIDGTTPLVAGLAGLAVGVEATTLLQCDLVYAAENASIRTPFLDLGLVPENASSYLGPLVMGYQRAFELLCLGEPFSAEKAREAGIVNKVVPVEALEDEAFAAATRLAAKPAEAMRITRDLMRQDNDARRSAAKAESAAFSERLASDEARAAFAAFLSRKAG